jgi:hypothetical protein
MGREEGEKITEEFSGFVPKAGNIPVILEAVEYFKVMLERGYSRAQIEDLLKKTFSGQDIENAFAFYEKFLRARK